MGNPIHITIDAIVDAPIQTVWKRWTSPDDIVKWNQASSDWHTVHASNDLKVGGKFSARMEAKDGSIGFDFEGTYETVVAHKQLVYTIADGRKVEVVFTELGHQTLVTETFVAEETNPVDMQRQGWQAILDSFKKYVEAV